MIRWLVVVVRRLLSLCLAAALAGCWTEGDLVHGAFTEDQWKHLQAEYSFQPGQAPACDAACLARAPFGQMLFFEPRLSSTAKVSCATCHDTAPSKPAGWYSDMRTDNAVSMGAVNPTPHNTISVVNVGFSRPLYGWSGECTDPATMALGDCLTPGNIVHDIALPKAMKSDATIVYATISTTPTYLAAYQRLFGPLDPSQVQINVEAALDAYLRRLVSIDAPFDKFLGGNDQVLDASATHGFAVFVGTGMCAECHRGPLFTDGLPHVTGVTDAKLDKGRGGTGAFLTPPLRHVAETRPYMHNGSLATLADVIWFYRQGGDASGYVGTKDPLMQKLDISDSDAKDLEAFLRTLTGAPIESALRKDTHVCLLPMGAGREGTPCGDTCTDVATDVNNCGSCGMKCGTGLTCSAGACVPGASCMQGLASCGTACVNLASDFANCGSCGNTCMTGTSCVNGACTAAPPPPPMCPMPLTQCGMSCFDLSTDPMSCGMCGNVCPANKPTCTLGSCHP